MAHPSATVTINGSSTVRKGESFWKEASAANSSPALHVSITNKATHSGLSDTNIGSLFVRLTPEVFRWDADGNLTNDGGWVYTWDRNSYGFTLNNPVTGVDYLGPASLPAMASGDPALAAVLLEAMVDLRQAAICRSRATRCRRSSGFVAEGAAGPAPGSELK